MTGAIMNKEGLLRVFSGTAALVVSVTFAAAYNWANLNNTAYSHSGAVLPLATGLFAKAAPFGLALPPVFAGFGLFVWRKKGSGFMCRIFAHAAYLFSFAWVLAAVLVWTLPYLAIGELAWR